MSQPVIPSQMKRVAFAVAAAVSLATGSVAWAASQDSQLVNFSVTNISQIDVAPGPVTLSIVAPAAGATMLKVTGPGATSI